MARYAILLFIVAMWLPTGTGAQEASTAPSSANSVHAEHEYYARLVSLRPSDTNSWYRLGIAKYKLRQYKEAVASFSACLELDSTHQKARFNRGVCYAAAGRNTDAFIDFNYCLGVDSLDLDARLNRAGCFFRAGNFERARQDIALVTELSPSSIAAWALSAAIHARMGKYKKAIHDYSICLAYDRKDISSLNSRGVSYLRLGLIDSAVADFKRVQALDSSYSMAQSNLALAYIQSKNYEQAEVYVNALLDELSHEAYAWEIAGDYSWMRRRYAESALRYTRGIRLQHSKDLFRKRAYSYLNIDSLNRAVDDFTTVLSYDSTDYTIWYNRGLVFMRKSDFASARRDFAHVIDMKPTYSLAWYYKGLALAREGEAQEGIRSITRAIELDTLHAEYFFNRSMLYLGLQDTSAANSDLHKTVAVNSSHIQAWYQLGILSAVGGEWKVAKKHLSKSIELSEGAFADALFARAQVHAELHKEKAALRDIQDFLNVASESHPNRNQAEELQSVLTSK